MERIALIGFGEAGQAFAGGWRGVARGYDIKLDRPEDAEAKCADFARFGIDAAGSTGDAIDEASLILSLVTAEQAEAATDEAATHIPPGALFCDMNSIAPDTKRRNAQVIEAAGGRYVDVAVMAPVHPQQVAVPLLVSGPHADAAAAALIDAGFSRVRVVPGDVGRASAIKMIRSVMVKGLEALTTECVLAANAAGVLEEVVASLNASWPGTDWAYKADYNLNRMMIHGLRRAAEMEEVVKTLNALGTGSMMTRGTVECQRAIGRLGVASPPDRLEPKIATLAERTA
ncbi:NAD(P)-dependent oxidoreductase [Sphingobium sp. CFD-2]|uniref:NAD(P)-dependent oxidoreductase n=1 Tax=Sphingobium sp. CFD-2 TaxID=2878542 RepID=UPI00214BC83F|nr:NAD(P)-dependent oxidoreductase [Sphingobium sp. CFD-2]